MGASATPAMFNLAVGLQARGKLRRAEKRYQARRRSWPSPRLVRVGMLLEKRGELGEAEDWYRRAADLGDILAMFALGLLLARAESEEAEQGILAPPTAVMSPPSSTWGCCWRTVVI